MPQFPLVGPNMNRRLRVAPNTFGTRQSGQRLPSNRGRFQPARRKKHLAAARYCSNPSDLLTAEKQTSYRTTLPSEPANSAGVADVRRAERTVPLAESTRERRFRAA